MEAYTHAMLGTRGRYVRACGRTQSKGVHSAQRREGRHCEQGPPVRLDGKAEESAERSRHTSVAYPSVA